MATIIEDKEVVYGKSYDLTIISSIGKVYTQPFKYATKVIDEASDLAVFNCIDSTTKFAGYYILANNVDATGYTHTHTFTGDYAELDRVGLTGIFDGNGYTISNLNITCKHGLFGRVYGGTIKNVAFKNATLYAGRLTGFFAARIFGEAVIDNLYLDLEYTGSQYWTGALASDIRSSVSIKNSIIEVDYKGGSQKYYGSIGGYTASDNSAYKPVFNNVYVVSTTPLFVNSVDNYATDASNRTNAAEYAGFITCDGVKRFDSALPTNDAGYSAFSSTCWNITSGVPVWNNKA